MAEIIVRTDAAKLQEFENKLLSVQEAMLQNVQQLDAAYHRAVWNDMVSEKAREQLNHYIDQLNRSLSCLSGIIHGVDRLQSYAAQYEAME